ncbi:MAG: methylglyoxal synthase [Oscillospiraceae bacterium]|nr:methylglyoxal synthase [Oscillospiraceae bacterium]
MEIAIIADDNKKGLAVEFCIGYVNVLNKHRLFGTWTTAKYIKDNTGLDVEAVNSGDIGGIEQLTSRITYNEIDLLLFFRDPHLLDYSRRALENEMLRMCDVNNIPVATNIGTAEALVMAMDRGDFGWREIENPRSNFNVMRNKRQRYY